MICLAVHLHPRLCRLCHHLALHSGLCLSRLRRPLLQLAARLLYLVAQALLQSTPFFWRHLRGHLRSHASSGDKSGATGTTGPIGGTRSLWSGYGICRGQQSQGQVLNPTRHLRCYLYLMAQALLQSTPLFCRHLRRQQAQGQVLNPTRHLRRHLYLVAQALLQSTPLFSRHLRRQQAQGQVLNPTRHLRRHLRSQKASGNERGAKRKRRSFGTTRSLRSGYGVCRGFPELLLQSAARRQHQL